MIKPISPIIFVAFTLFHESAWTLAPETESQLTATPSDLPLLQQSDLAYEGAFRMPAVSGDSFSFGGAALTFNPANNSLFLNGHIYDQLTAEISIPKAINSTTVDNLNRATLLQPFADVTNGKRTVVGECSNGCRVGGLLMHGGQLYSTVFRYYDGSGNQSLSHFRSSPLLSKHDAQGPYSVGSMGAGFVSGYMATIPSEWQTLFGGPALTGNACLSIITRTSWGPGAFVFNPADVGVQNPAPAVPLVYYNGTHPTLGDFDATGTNEFFNGATKITGLVFPSGTRSVLFFGRHGTGTWCYGTGGASGECIDPALSSKGGHAYPYVYQVWAYDANDLLKVKNGQKEPWSVVPYGVWHLTMPFSSTDIHDVGGAAYDPATQRLFVSQMCREGCTPIIQVFRVNAPTSVSNKSIDAVQPGITVNTNPFNREVTITVGIARETYQQILVFNMGGHVVADLTSHVLNGRVTWNTAQHPNGRYVVQIKGKNAMLHKAIALLE